MSLLQQYNPMKWPPDIKLAELHYNCSKPGIDNTEGARCPCCNRFQKLDNSKWPTRDITKDFKNYGGGVPGYFYLLWYFISFLLALTLIKVIYHIIVLEQVCPQIQHDPQIACTKMIGVFKFCDSSILYDQLEIMGKKSHAQTMQYLQLVTYLILVFSTIGIKIFLQLINKDKISLDQKLFSRFSLIIKGVPRIYGLQDLKQELKCIDPKVCINQMFYLHKSCEYETSYRELFDRYFHILHLESNLSSDDREKKLQEMRKEYEDYLDLYDKVQKEESNLRLSSKKVLVVFNTIEQKQKIHKELKMNEFAKFVHYIFRILNCKRDPIGYYSQRLTQPQQIHWKNIGQSSTQKLKVRMETTFLGIGFMILSFAIFYFPMLKIDEQKIDKPSVGTALGFLISILIIILAIVYRRILILLMPTRKPSSKLAEAYFIVMTTIIFHFFFYLVTPAAFYVFAQSIPVNYKLKQFFSAVFTFSLMCLIVALIDLRYRLYKKRRERLLGQASQSNNYCQQRLHEQLTPPSFPIEFKLMVAFNIWSFNSFYIFELPYLIFLFMIILFLLYWIDKFNLYKHYKMQQYMSIELEIKVQKTYIIFFLICVSGGYYFSTTYLWEKITIIGVVIFALIVNFTLNYTYKKQKDDILKHNTDLKSAIQQSKSSIGLSFHMNLIQNQMKSSLLLIPQIIEFSEASLASQIISYGYHEAYNLFLSQFKNKHLNGLMEEKYIAIKHSKTVLDGRKRSQSELAHLLQNGLSEKLIKQQAKEEQQINRVVNSEAEILINNNYVPPQETITIVPIVDLQQNNSQTDSKKITE